jgi:hypothetical protein
VLDDSLLPAAAMRGVGNVKLPRVADGYVTPHFRTVIAEDGVRPADEQWWGDQSVYTLLEEFLALHFTTAESVQLPLIILGGSSRVSRSRNSDVDARAAACSLNVVQMRKLWHRNGHPEVRVPVHTDRAVGDLVGSCCDRLVDLRHPGAGKSLFTKVLAAKLPSESYTTVHVALRRVDAHAPVYR